MPTLTIVKTNEFSLWFNSLKVKDQAIVDARMAKIEQFQYFGDCKNLSNGLLELRWLNGRRIYFTKIKNQSLLLLIGGYKNDQTKDIKKARLLLRELTGTNP